MNDNRECKHRETLSVEGGQELSDMTLLTFINLSVARDRRVTFRRPHIIAESREYMSLLLQEKARPKGGLVKN